MNFGASFELDARAKVVSEARESSSSMSLAYVFKTQGKNAVLTNLRATDMARAARSRGTEAVKEACSEEFVQQVELGGKLILVVKIDLGSEWMNSDIEANLKLKVMKIFEAEGGYKTKKYSG